MRTVFDPFEGKTVEISDRLVDRLRGKYASGPHLPNGNPEFGWRQFESPPIQHEAADRIEALEGIMACLLDSYIFEFGGKDALAHKAEALVPNWQEIAAEFDPTK